MTRMNAALVALIALLPGVGNLATPGPRSKEEVRLERGTPVSVLARNQPLSQVLERLQKATGMEIRVTDDFGRIDRQALSRKVSLAIRRETFWEAVLALQKEAGLHFWKVSEGGIELRSRARAFRQSEPTGDPVVAGSFLCTPEWHTFFKRAMVTLRPEPWIEGFRVSAYRATLALGGGKTLEFEPANGSADTDVHGEVSLDLDPDLPEGTNRAEKLQLEASVTVPVDIREETTPPLGRMVPPTSRCGNAALRVIEARRPGDGDDGQLRVHLEVDGAELDPGGIRLIDATGASHEPGFSNLYGRDPQTVRLGFKGDTVAGDAKDLDLHVDIPVIETRNLGKVASLTGKTVDVGLMNIRFRRIGPDSGQFTVTAEIRGGSPATGTMLLITPGGKKVEPTGFSSIGTGLETRRLSASYALKDLGTSPGDCVLVLDVPVKKETHTISDIGKRAAPVLRTKIADILVLGAAEEDSDSGDGKDLRIRFVVRGAPVRAEKIQLVDARNRSIETSGWSSSSGPQGQSLSVTVPASRVQGQLETSRLRIPVPSATIEHTLEVTLEDVPLAR